VTPEQIERDILPQVDLSWCTDVEKAIVLTAMYDHDARYNYPEEAITTFQQVADVIKRYGKETPFRIFYDTRYIIPKKSDADLIKAFSNPFPYSKQDYFQDYPLYTNLASKRRFQHTWVTGESGSGKTTLLENLIFQDLEEVTKKQATVLVMDSQGKHELLGRIERAYPCTTIDTTTPMNIFARPRTPQNARDAEIMYTAQIDLITYVFSATLGEGGTFTPKQNTLWTFLVQLVMEAEGTVADMLKLLQPKGLDHYRQIIPRLQPPARLFFTNSFDDPKQYTDTKKELQWRLDSLLQRPSFARMFTQKRALDFYSLLQEPRCILVDTDKALLGPQGTEIFGRFIIATLLSVSQQRGNVAAQYRLPTYCYIDECHDYIATDPNISTIIDQARKMKMAFTFAHQRESNIKDPDVLDALHHCGVQFKASYPEKHFAVSGIDDPNVAIITSPPQTRPPKPEIKGVPATTVTPFIHEGEVLPPEPPRGLTGPKPKVWGEDDIDQEPK
jgi:hypothetical protein